MNEKTHRKLKVGKKKEVQSHVDYCIVRTEERLIRTVGFWRLRYASFKWLSVFVLAVTWKCAFIFMSDPEGGKHSQFEGNTRTYAGGFI